MREWPNDVSPCGRLMIQSEIVRGEGRYHWIIPTPGGPSDRSVNQAKDELGIDGSYRRSTVVARAKRVLKWLDAHPEGKIPE